MVKRNHLGTFSFSLMVGFLLWFVSTQQTFLEQHPQSGGVGVGEAAGEPGWPASVQRGAGL